jgi:hypothetical protein
MEQMMLDEASEEPSSFHACGRPDCTRIFRDSIGYLDFVEGAFDESRSSVQRCPRCGSALYLAEADHFLKIETLECPHTGCGFAVEHRSPSAR